MIPFNFLGQDSGTLIDYYSGVLRSKLQLPYDYVILEDTAGGGLIYLSTTTSNLTTTAIVADEFNYTIVFGGDFFGNFDENVYSAVIREGSVDAGNKETGLYKISLAGQVSGVLLDKPTLKYELLGTIQSGISDLGQYRLNLSSGQVSGVSIDRSSYAATLKDGFATGNLKDSPVFVVTMLGKIEKIYKESVTLSMDFGSGILYAGAVMFEVNTGDPINLGFTFDNGAFYGS